MQQEAIRYGEVPPEPLPPDTPLLVVPAGLVRILDRDPKLSRIPKKDARAWATDARALRPTFAALRRASRPGRGLTEDLTLS